MFKYDKRFCLSLSESVDEGGMVAFVQGILTWGKNLIKSPSVSESDSEMQPGLVLASAITATSMYNSVTSSTVPVLVLLVDGHAEVILFQRSSTK